MTKAHIPPKNSVGFFYQIYRHIADVQLFLLAPKHIFANLCVSIKINSFEGGAEQ